MGARPTPTRHHVLPPPPAPRPRRRARPPRGLRRGRRGRGGAGVLGDGRRGREGAAAHRAVRGRAPRHPRGGPAAALDLGPREAADGVRGPLHARRVAVRQHVGRRDGGARRAGGPHALRPPVGRGGRGRLLPRRLGHQRDRRPAVGRPVVRRHADPLLPHRPVRRGGLCRDAGHVGRLDGGHARSPDGPAGRRLPDPAARQRVRAAAHPRPQHGRRAPRRRPLRQLPQRWLPARVHVLRGPLPRGAGTGDLGDGDLEPVPGDRPRALREHHHRALEHRRVPAPPHRAPRRLGHGAHPRPRPRHAGRLGRGRGQPGHLRALAPQGRGVAAGRVPVAARHPGRVQHAHGRSPAAGVRLGDDRPRGRPLRAGLL